MNTVQHLFQAGQSIWYDNIQRGLLHSGELAGMIARGEIRGVTSNPTIFMNAITKSTVYAAELARLAKTGLNASDIFWQLAVEDIQATADLFAPLYHSSNGGDGYVSLEVNPTLANDTDATLAEAQRLWARVNRPNLMIKIPATRAGLPAITAAIAAGLNVNVTLIFSRQRYGEVMEAYIAGLEQRAAAGLPLDRIASVASFFVSRVDSKVDAQLAKIAAEGGRRGASAARLQGKAAVANAKLAYADFKRVFGRKRFQKLATQGARVQRPLWASTGTKNPRYSDVLYVDELIGPDTVNTVPPQTLAAFLDHGQVRPTLEAGIDQARRTLRQIEALGISMDDVTEQLEIEGVKSFADAFSELLTAVEHSRLAAL